MEGKEIAVSAVKGSGYMAILLYVCLFQWR
jgi:hypothetical protein